MDAPPTLADAYADAAPGDPRGATPPGWGFDPALSDRYARRVRLGATGAGVTLVGLGVATVGSLVFTVGVVDCVGAAFSDRACAGGTLGTGLLLIGAGGVTAVVGEVVMFTGALGAAYDGRALGLNTSPTLGWVGVGLIGGGIALSVTEAALPGASPLDGALSTASGVMGLGGLVCGGLQFVQVRGAGRAAGLVVVPVPGGLGVAGRLGRDVRGTGADPR